MSKKETVDLFIAGIIFAVVLALALGLKLIDTAQAIQIIISFVLVLVTVIYVKRTADIANATKEQAQASVKMAEEMRDTRYDAVRPVIDIINIGQTPLELGKQAYEKKPPSELRCELCNVGFGPAIDVYSFVQPPSEARRRYDFGIITVRETKLKNLSLEHKDTHWFLVAYYKDIYGRCFKSSREVRAGVVNPDPLEFNQIACEELPK